MKIGVIGAGNVGTALGENWQSKGYSVRYGVTDANDPKHVRIGANRVGSPRDIATWAEVIVLATPWTATEAACHGLGSITGKTVVDCTNPLAMSSSGLGLAFGFSTSGGEIVQSWCPGASVFKTLNQVGFETMSNPALTPQRPVMFVAGDDEAKKPSVLTLIGDLGFEAVDAGPLAQARLLEPFAMLWIDLAFKRGQGRDFAFSLTRPSRTSR